MKFLFNEHDVCINSIKEVLWNDKKFHCSILLAERDGKWLTGCSFDIRGTGRGCGGRGGYPAFNQYRIKYPTKEAARRSVIRMAIEFFSGINEDHPCGALSELLKAELQGHQLQLF